MKNGVGLSEGVGGGWVEKGKEGKFGTTIIA